ncbi:TPA: DUF1642 domain-containing protein [Streptococcus suis]
MNKQEAIEKINGLWSFVLEDEPFEVDLINKSLVIEIISQIHGPQKVIVPKFVAGWLEYCKSNELTLLGAFDPVSEHGIGLANTIGFTGEVWKGIDWAKRNQDTFARAWLDGYAVEQEKLYTVEIPNPVITDNSDSVTVLMKTDLGVVLTDVVNYIGRKQESSYQLTEAEIKQDFDFLWQFAKEVEDE